MEELYQYKNVIKYHQIYNQKSNIHIFNIIKPINKVEQYYY